LKTSSSCIKRVVHVFGREILTKGEIDRKKLGKIVFDHPQKLKLLTNILHPVVKKEILSRLKRIKRSKTKVLVVEVPLLFEAGWERMMDYSIVVQASQRTQIKRAKYYLKLSSSEATLRIRRQWPLQIKIRLADIIIDNNESKIKTKRQVACIWQKIQQKNQKS
jgi:dephospho-CoA kinase